MTNPTPNIMRPQQSIYWHQGMLLQPQHFQCSERAMHFQFSALHLAHPPMWGVGALDLDAAGLDAGRVEVRRARLLLRDHTLVEYPGNAVLATRALPIDAVDPEHGLDVHLGIRRLDPDAPNATVCESPDACAAAPTRFAALEHPPDVPDILADDPPVPVHRLAHVLRLFFGSEARESGPYELIRIARLVRVGPHIQPCAQFAPPAFALTGAPSLARVLMDVRDATAACMRALGTPCAGGAESLLTRIVLARTLAALSTLTDSGHVHPFDAYAQLRGCVAELLVIAPCATPAGTHGESGIMALPPYAHEAPHACFALARRLAMQALAALAPGPEFVRAFVPTGQRDVLSAVLPTDAPGGSARERVYWVVANPRAGSRWLEDAPLGYLRIAAEHALRTLDQHALPGLAVAEVVAPPSNLPRRAGARCFRIDASGPLWDAARSTGALGAHWPGSGQQIDLELVVLRANSP